MARKRKASGNENDSFTSPTKRRVYPGSNKEREPANQHAFDPYPTAKVYRLIEPGPVLLVTTGSLVKRTHNVMTIGFHMVIKHESPPLLVFP